MVKDGSGLSEIAVELIHYATASEPALPCCFLTVLGCIDQSVVQSHSTT